MTKCSVQSAMITNANLFKKNSLIEQLTFRSCNAAQHVIAYLSIFLFLSRKQSRWNATYAYVKRCKTIYNLDQYKCRLLSFRVDLWIEHSSDMRLQTLHTFVIYQFYCCCHRYIGLYSYALELRSKWKEKNSFVHL